MRAARPGDLTPRSSASIVLLGIDGVGKTTTAEAVAQAARDSDTPVIVLRNPAGRRWLGRVSARFEIELPVRWTDRFETVVRTVNVLASKVRAWHRDGLVIIDRHLVCQLVLRQVRGLPQGRFLPWMAHALLGADTVVVLDVPAEVAYERIRARGEDSESLDFLRATRAAYVEMAQNQGWGVVDATGPTDAITRHIREITGPR